MTIHRPTGGLILTTAVSIAAFFGLAARGWGSWSGLVAQPVRSVGLGLIGLAAFLSLFSGIHLGGCAGANAHGRWRLIPLALISLALAWFPPFAEPRQWGTFGGQSIRLAGLVLLGLGALFRVGPMFLLGDRFTWPLAKQRAHPLLTTGFYRFIRHPSYAGALVGAIGWVLLFRSGPGLLLVAALFPFFNPVIQAEEALLFAEFGADYATYCQRTWRLIPFLY